MGHSISWGCKKCNHYGKIVLFENREIHCPQCDEFWGFATDHKKIFENCPICHCRQFYVQKDFNQLLGCVVMLMGIVLVPKTYGLSLPVFALLDWIVYTKISNMAVCYRCGAEFRGFQIPPHFTAFQHHIGMKYDKYR